MHAGYQEEEFKQSRTVVVYSSDDDNNGAVCPTPPEGGCRWKCSIRSNVLGGGPGPTCTPGCCLGVPGVTDEARGFYED